MKLHRLVYVVGAVLLLFVAVAEGAPDKNEARIIPVGEEDYTCYDYSVQYAKNDSSWGIVTIGNNQLFKGVSHMVNYKHAGKNLLIHDGLYKLDYVIHDYKNTKQYFHFWERNQTPCRVYRFLQPNVLPEVQNG